MFRNHLNHLLIRVCLLLLMFASSTIWAQPQRPTPASKAKAGQETCDGALDIVPSKSATFMRKRRVPSKKSTPKSDPKTEQKSENKSS